MTSGRQKAGEHSRSRLHEPDAYGGSKVGASSIASKPSASYQDSEGRMEDGGVSKWIRGAWDWMGLVIDNEGSTCRDHLARERNVLSWLRLSVTLFVISAALFLQFQLGSDPVPEFEKQISTPLGSVFFGLAVICLFTGIFGYFETQFEMQNRLAFVTSGSHNPANFVIVIAAVVIGASCILLLIADKEGLVK